MSDAYLQDVAELGPSDEKLNTITLLAAHQQDLEDQIAHLEQEMQRLSAQLTRVSEQDLPEALSNAGIADFTLANGSKVGVETKIYARPAKDDKPQMLDWLEENEHGNLIKRDVVVNFGRNEENHINRLVAWVRANLPRNDLKADRYVEPSTLRAFVKEQLMQQVDLPDTFGAVVVRRSFIKRPKILEQL